ncbi:uncharacterized protein LOC129301661 [Prosopis cineraria]|uniref:uncharacterized protein LOC129301661 n=1 Tax=Prosopis cineraria TaxID=364024 RepID=UPI00240EBF8E|nr:uncharacterized protein LOC129301661 [Prosopis cineraria]
MELALGIRGAVGTDDVDPVVTAGRCYCVLYWIEPDNVFHTRPVHPSRNNPVWEELDVLPVLDYAPENSGFLHGEVARLCSDTDPGPSSGSVIVGRARVPLPKIPYCTIEDRFGLVKHIGEGHMCLAGDIILCMKLQRAWPFQRPDYMINNQQLENSDSGWSRSTHRIN